MSEPSAGGNGVGDAPVDAGGFEAFLAQLAGTVAERVQQLGKKAGSQPDPVFLDEAKTVVEWPELGAYVIEELR